MREVEKMECNREILYNNNVLLQKGILELENSIELYLERGFDQSVIKGIILIFWYLIIVLFIFIFCLGSVFAAYSTIYQQDGRDYWILGVIFLLAGFFLFIKYLPTIILTVVREIFGTYTLYIEREFVDVNWCSSIYSGSKRVQREMLGIGWFGSPMTPVLMAGKGGFCFGALFTNKNWEDAKRALWPEFRAEQKH
jgi:hypothetical protein